MLVRLEILYAEVNKLTWAQEENTKYNDISSDDAFDVLIDDSIGGLGVFKQEYFGIPHSKHEIIEDSINEEIDRAYHDVNLEVFKVALRATEELDKFGTKIFRLERRLASIGDEQLSNILAQFQKERDMIVAEINKLGEKRIQIFLDLDKRLWEVVNTLSNR